MRSKTTPKRLRSPEGWNLGRGRRLFQPRLLPFRRRQNSMAPNPPSMRAQVSGSGTISTSRSPLIEVEGRVRIGSGAVPPFSVMRLPIPDRSDRQWKSCHWAISHARHLGPLAEGHVHRRAGVTVIPFRLCPPGYLGEEGAPGIVCAIRVSGGPNTSMRGWISRPTWELHEREVGLSTEGNSEVFNLLNAPWWIHAHPAGRRRAEDEPLYREGAARRTFCRRPGGRRRDGTVLDAFDRLRPGHSRPDAAGQTERHGRLAAHPLEEQKRSDPDSDGAKRRRRKGPAPRGRRGRLSDQAVRAGGTGDSCPCAPAPRPGQPRRYDSRGRPGDGSLVARGEAAEEGRFTSRPRNTRCWNS